MDFQCLFEAGVRTIFYAKYYAKWVRVFISVLFLGVSEAY
jgi:hypothetical protein